MVWEPGRVGYVCIGGITLVSSLCILCHIIDFVGRSGTVQNYYIFFVENGFANFICSPDKASESQTLPNHSREGIHFQRYFLPWKRHMQTGLVFTFYNLNN